MFFKSPSLYKPFQAKGEFFFRGGENYELHRYQYASSSQESADSMAPAVIFYAKDESDVISAVKYASDNNLAIAVRTGGHQYSGASSTAGKNIQLDMSEMQPVWEWNPDTGLLRVSINFALKDFNAKLGEMELFVPHGQCSHVHLGGHVQTGGYGQLGRSFGLMGDHIESFEIIMADGNKRIVNRDSVNADDNDLFYAVLGGSPGNFGILTHLTLKPHKDSDHPKSRGLKAVYPYSRETLKQLLDVMVKMVNDEELAGDYDFCVTVLSASEVVLPDFFPGKDKEMAEHHQRLYGDNTVSGWPASIIVYAQWANLDGSLQIDNSKSWFDEIKNAGGDPLFPYGWFGTANNDNPTPMSKLTKQWVFRNVREYELPYEKRTYITNSKTLAQDNWTSWVCGRIDEIQSDITNGCKLSCQIQHFGGQYSRFRQKSEDGRTAYSWRGDSSICCVLDCFYNQLNWWKWLLSFIRLSVDPKVTAMKWANKNDAEGLGVNGKFCKQDRRVLWGSYGKKNLDEVWNCYYESRAKYERLLEIKRRVDPNGVFTPNTFCVGGGPVYSPIILKPNDKTMAESLRERRARQLSERVKRVRQPQCTLTTEEHSHSL